MQVPIEDKAKMLLHLSRILFTLITLGKKKIIFINNVVVCTAKRIDTYNLIFVNFQVHRLIHFMIDPNGYFEFFSLVS